MPENFSTGTGADNVTDAVSHAIASYLASYLNTAIPGVVTRVYPKDPKNPSGPKLAKIDARPIIKKKFRDGSELAYEAIPAVPVVFPRTGKVRMSFPLDVGDGVLLIFSQRSTENFLFSGGETAPSRPEMFALTDAIAIPGLFPFGEGLDVGELKKFEIVTKNIDLLITNGQATIETDGLAVKINEDGLTVDA